MPLTIDHWGYLLGGFFVVAGAFGRLLASGHRQRQELQRRAEQLHAISLYTYDWEIWLGPKGEPLWVNAAAGRMTGLSSAEALAIPDYPLPLVADADQGAVRSALELVKEGGIVDDQLFRVRRQDGSTLAASLSAQQIFATNGTLLGSRLNIRDVSILIGYQEEMERKRRVLQSLLDNSSDGILALDQDFRVIFFNNRFLQLWGIERSFLAERPTIQDLIRETCRIGLYPAAAEEELITQRLRVLSALNTRIALESPRQDGVIVETFAAPLPGIGFLLSYRDITERKLAEEALRKNEAKHRAMIENIVDVLAVIDAEGINRYKSPNIARWFGWQPEEVVGRSTWDLIHPDDLERTQGNLARLLAAPEVPVTAECRYLCRDGHYKWIEYTAINRLHNPDIAGILLSYRDISAGRAAAEKEREQAALVQSILDTIPAPIFYKDSDANYLGCNLAFAEYVGHPRAEIVGKSVFDLAPPDLARIYDDADLELLRSGGVQSYETQVVFADNSRREVLFSKAVFHRSDGSAAGLVGTMLDITARKGAELALKESESRYKELFHEFETIFNGIPDSLTVWSRDNAGEKMRLVWANTSGSRDYALPDAELLGKEGRELSLLTFDHDPDCEIRRCFSSGSREEGVRKTRDGRTWGVKTFPLRNGAGIVDRVIRVASDLTERMVLREEATRAAHLAALGELAAGMAHEINNPTSLILLEMPILQEVFNDSREILEEYFLLHGDFFCGGLPYSKMRQQVPAMIAEIRDGAERIKEIVEELRDFSHPTESHHFERVDLNAVVRKALGLVGNQVKKTTDHFSVTYAPLAPATLGSLSRLEQVVINLLLNACQALPDRQGRLTVETGSWPERSRAFIRVSDTGTGILPEHLNLITDPFFTTRRAAGGTGLGLSVSTRIIEEHGGTLHFVSEPGKGTVVTIDLPLAQEDNP